jgi:hypothetical protein
MTGIDSRERSAAAKQQQHASGRDIQCAKPLIAIHQREAKEMPIKLNRAIQVIDV